MTKLTPQFHWSLRQTLALLWAFVVFLGGIFFLVLWPFEAQEWLFVGLAALVLFTLDAVGVRDRTRQPLSMVGVVLLVIALVQPAGTVIWLAFCSGLLIKPPRTWTHWSEVVLRRMLEAGARSIPLGCALVLVGATDSLLAFLLLLLFYVCGIYFIRWIFTTLWEANRRLEGSLKRWFIPSLFIEVLPLPLALVGAEIVRLMPWPLVTLAAAGLIASAIMIRRSIRSLGQQRRTLAELGQINAISRAIIRAELDVDALCNLIYVEASKIVDTRNFRLGLFNGRTFELKVRIQEGIRQPALVVQLNDDEGIIGWMRRTGRSLLIHDFEVEMEHLPARPTYQAEDPPRSGVYIPLLTGDEVIGTISIQSREPNVFDTEDLRILSLIADQSATAIDKARAYNAARRRAAQLATISEVSRQITAILDLDRLLPSVVQLIRSSFGYYHVQLFTLDSETTELVFRASTNPDSAFWRKQGQRLAPGAGIIGQVARTGELMLVNDVRHEPNFIQDQVGIASELAIPLRVGTHLIGVLDVQSEQLAGFDENDIFVLQTLADQIAIAIDSANIFAEQQAEAWVLNALLQSAENIAWINNLEEVLDLGVRLPGMLLGCKRVLCLLWHKDVQAWQIAASWGFDVLPLSADIQAEAMLASLDLLRKSGEAQILDDQQQQTFVRHELFATQAPGALLALPLTARATTLGMMVLEQSGTRWLKRQITIATGIAGQIAAAIEGALLAQAEAERYHLEQEINVARELQTSLLPLHPPQLEGWDLAAVWRSARQVGGDFFDFWRFHSGPAAGQLGFVIADVSDKGVPAALFMALSRSLVRAAALDGTSPARAMERANRWIVRDSQASMFVTLFYGILDPYTGLLRYTCAGHNPPILYRAATQQIETLRTPGIALGVLDEINLFEAETTLEPADVLLCYTDGVTEAVNDALDEWGVDALVATIQQQAHLPTEGLVQSIIDQVAEHAGERSPFDDITMVAIKCIQTETAFR